MNKMDPADLNIFMPPVFHDSCFVNRITQFICNLSKYL